MAIESVVSGRFYYFPTYVHNGVLCLGIADAEQPNSSLRCLLVIKSSPFTEGSGDHAPERVGSTWIFDTGLANDGMEVDISFSADEPLS